MRFDIFWVNKYVHYNRFILDNKWVHCIVNELY